MRGGGRKGDLPEEDQGHSRKAKGQAGEGKKDILSITKSDKNARGVLEFCQNYLDILQFCPLFSTSNLQHSALCCSTNM